MPRTFDLDDDTADTGCGGVVAWRWWSCCGVEMVWWCTGDLVVVWFGSAVLVVWFGSAVLVLWCGDGADAATRL